MLEHYPELDAGKTLLMCLIHDIGEIYDGDISAALLLTAPKNIKENIGLPNGYSLCCPIDKRNLLWISGRNMRMAGHRNPVW